MMIEWLLGGVSFWGLWELVQIRKKVEGIRAIMWQRYRPDPQMPRSYD
jgi:hypothetical protein